MKLMKIKNYTSAVQRLAEGIADYTAYPSSTMRDGVIQRFEFTFELAWKSLKEYMTDQGVTTNLQFPKQVLKEAYAAGIISHESVWIDMLTSRNITSHIYDDKQATAIMSDITGRFLGELEHLSQFYSK